jgi:hypothetical protein
MINRVPVYLFVHPTRPIEKAGDEKADPPIYGTTPWTAPFVLGPGARRRRDDDIDHIGA